MKWDKLLRLAGLLTLVVLIFAFPAVAQDKGCGCGKQQEKKACCGTCQDKAKKACCGTCQDKKSCGGGCQKKDAKDPMAAMADCKICQYVFQDVELVKNCDWSVSDYSNGILFTLVCKDPKMMKRFRAFEDREKKLCEKFKGLKDADRAKHLCPGCNKYFAFMKHGAKEERIKTPTGTVTMISSKDPAMVKKLHAFAAEMRKGMENFDMSQLEAPKKAKGCGGGCGGCSKKAKAAPAPAPVKEKKKVIKKKKGG